MNDVDRSGTTLRDLVSDGGTTRDGSGPGPDPFQTHLERLPPALRAAAAEQIVTLIARSLDRRVVDVLASGWREWEQLRAAARRTLDDPNATEIVELIDHEISSAQRPHVDVTFDGRRIAEVEGEASVAIVVHAATAVVEGGRVTALRSGRADVDVRLSVEGATITEARTQIDLSIEIPLGDGIPLVGRADGVTVLPEAQPSTASTGTSDGSFGSPVRNSET